MATAPSIDVDRKLVRVLVVDDYEPFRLFLCSTLARRPELKIVCEVSNGLAAVQKAGELHPDLILLDVGLPMLNGIEAARRIRMVSPASKIIFVSQQFSADLAQEALNLGAMGYVAKAHVGSELLTALDAVRRGRRFVSPVIGTRQSRGRYENSTSRSLQ